MFPLFLPHDAVNASADLFGFFYLGFEYKIPLVECFPPSGQLGIFAASLRLYSDWEYPDFPS